MRTSFAPGAGGSGGVILTIVNDPWGVDEPPAAVALAEPLPPRLARLAEVQATGVARTVDDPHAAKFPRAEELPEVQALMREGWRTLDAGPLHCLLPASWPSRHRTWVPDRLPRVAMCATTDHYVGRMVPAELDDDWQPNEAAEDAGLPAPPSRRIWLLRSPWPRIPVSVIYQIIWSLVEGRPGHDEIQRVYRAGCDVLAWDESRALAACPPRIKELLEAWATAGRVGEAAAAVIRHGLAPADLARMTTMTGLEETAALAWLDSLDADLDDEVIAFISAWRSAGLPGNPPPGARRFSDREPIELRGWLDAGFDLYAAHQLGPNGLAASIAWRDAGFSEAETYELLRDDPDLSPEEARAFDASASGREHRRAWISLGFTAAEATVWTGVGLTPFEARLWRVCAQQPSDVAPGVRLPPQLTITHSHGYVTALRGGERSYSEWDHLVDPPGTRGRRARRRAGDDDPRINVD